MSPATRTRAALAVIVCTLLIGGCGQGERTPNATPTRASASSPQSPEPEPTDTPSRSAVYEPGPALVSSDGTLEAEFGAKYVGENGRTIANEMAAVVGVALANPDVASGKQTLRDALGGLPLTGDAERLVPREPETFGLPRVATGTRIPVAPFAEVLFPARMRVKASLDSYDGQKAVRAAFTGQVRLHYAEQGQRMTLDGERDFEVWLVPSTDRKGSRWFITGYRTSKVRFTSPAPAGR